MNKISEIRQKSCLLQKDFCKLFGISQSTLSEWENEKYNIPTGQLIKISKHFNVTTDYLLGLDKPNEETSA